MKILSITIPMLAAWFASTAGAAVLVSDTFDSSVEGWTSAGSMTVTHNDAEGTPAEDGALQGSFASQGFFFLPQTGSFRMSAGGSDFLGSYPGVDGLTGFTFDFMADSVMPLDLNLRLLSGVDAYYYTLDLSGLGLGAWRSYSVFFDASGWQGNAGVLANVTAVEVQVARGSAAAQLYYLDNFSTTTTPYGETPDTAIPEPSTALMVLYLGSLLYGTRKRLFSRLAAAARSRQTAAACAALLLLAASAQAADVAAEGFAGAESASESSLSIGAGAWTFTGGVARIAFAETAPYAIPDVATLRPSSGSFTGDYVAAGLQVLGFRFRAEGAAPSTLYVELAAGTSVYQRTFTVAPAGEWQSCMVSLVDAESGGWTVKRGSRAALATDLADVRSVAIKIGRNGAAATAYEIDDVFVDGLPKASGGVSMQDGDVSMTWEALQLGAPYTMQESPSLAGPWKDAQTVTPTSRLQQFRLPASGSASQAFFRLRGP